ncbi:hypothetical protein LTR16_000377 [Cryomyces antarcticus]|uniref:Mif2 N-terminal domain-containing protein n=1 Tax=Cryomyces antarcticus TaxID=329879 RepID=A0ABR0LR12_9PEZI|nr:hypothetical protein LTR16_000377 [Cryomyces antarcticus]
MTTTPPPPSRLRTPPTPLHGARFDSYEPYSTRKSSRVSAQRAGHTLSDHIVPDRLQRTRATTPTTTTRKRTLARTTSQTFSPPSSPATPAKARSPNNTKTPNHRRRLFGNGQDLRVSSNTGVDSDSDGIGRASTSFDPMTFDPRAMLPTPSKTPRRRPDLRQDALKPTARVLFGNQATSLEDTLATPSKRMSKHPVLFSRHGLGSDGTEDDRPEQIEIYTDSQCREPELDESEDNPFVVKKKDRPRLQTKGRTSFLRRTQDDIRRDSAMEEAAKNDEGIVYVFRGKKIFRRFDPPDLNATSTHAEEADKAGSSDVETAIRRQAGASTKRPFTRSTIKPRLLFPSEEQLSARNGKDQVVDDDEEAETDIECPELRPVTVASANDGGKSQSNLPKTDSNIHDSPRETMQKVVTTPTKRKFRIATPPTTTRTTRSGTKSAVDSSPLAPEPVERPQPQKRSGKKSSPFDAWQRIKAGGNRPVSQSKKREAEPMERESHPSHVVAGRSTRKRVRSGASTHGESV